MKIRSDIIKVYKDVHIWIGIVSGLMLFIAFYAGSITMFEKPLERWATPPSTLAGAPSLQQADALVEAVLAEHPKAASRYFISVKPGADQPARVYWQERTGGRRQFKEFAASFDADGSLQVEQTRKAPVAQLVDTLHQLVGLPFADVISRPIMGAVALAYAVALISGLIVLLPTLTKDMFALRIGKNIKRMWLDAHNALGLFSLPFHLVIALTSVVFAFHDQFYDAQDAAVYPTGIEWSEEPHEDPPAGARVLPAAELLRRVQVQLPGFEVQSFGFQRNDGHVEATVTGLDIRHGTRARLYASTHLDPYSGQVDPHDLPGHMDGWNESVNAFFMLHFGSFGGNPVRWLYLLMGLAGAALFYTGNLLWVESRRRKRKGPETPVQKISGWVLGCLTVGVSLGCVAGISASLAATKWLPALVDDLKAWHTGIYYTVFVVAIAWAFLRGAARGAVELLWASAVFTLAIPLSSVAGAWGVGGAWSHAGSWPVDVTALLSVPVMVYIAHRTQRRMRLGHSDSIWAQRTVRPVASA